MSARAPLLATVAVLASCYFVKMRANADGHIDGLFPAERATTNSSGVSTTLASAPTPDPIDWIAHGSREAQMIFWCGCIGVLLSVACCASCHSCCYFRPRYDPGRSRPLWQSSESTTQVQASQTTVQPASAQLRLVPGTAPLPTTYGTTIVPSPSPGDSPHDCPPGMPWGIQGSRGGSFVIGSPVLEPNREEDEFGYRVQLLQPVSDGLPSYDSVAGSRAHPYVTAWPGPQHPAAIGVPRSPPPPYSFQGYQR
ncbi:hypothetical protein HPB52_013863 [Rhipicephalus sanguineus]|uniref:Transmembrane protein n=1 Tax=Rhipicephalus sanguineus TaxID=34632 RepID=A0A9D4SMV2_RHISA|nr:hypothetical protein HPB52_013863 [Rhipicephalus sanguineus]